MMPKLCILIPTYQRPDVLHETVMRLFFDLQYSGEVEVVIGDDSADPEPTRKTVDDLQRVLSGDVRRTKPQPWSVRLVRGDCQGIAANMNKLLRSTESPLVMSLDDDHHLTKVLSLDRHAHALLAETNWLGYIRLMGVTGHRYTALLREVATPVGHIGYWQVRWESPELYIPSFRPNLRLRIWHTVFGFYPTHHASTRRKLTLGDTEEAWCHQCKDTATELVKAGLVPLHAAVPVTYDDDAWDHVGKTWQLTEHDQ
jgi:hypothetical protein